MIHKAKINNYLKLKDCIHLQRILIIHAYDKEELSKHSYGATRLIFEQERFLKRFDVGVRTLSLQEINSIVSKILNLITKSKVEKEISHSLRDPNRRWFINLLFIIILHYISKLDFIFKRNLSYIIEKYDPDLILCNYPTFATIVKTIAKKFDVPLYLYEHNVEWKIFQNLLNNKMRYRPFIYLMKRIELGAIKKADKVICVTDKDSVTLQHYVTSDKIFTWVPFTLSDKKTETANFRRGEFIIGFVGAYFEPNIVAVENIIKIAAKLDNNIKFLILGKVCDAFIDRDDIPDNIIFKGYVEDLDSYLSFCNAFINPKTISDTGIEVKMFDYIKFNKPIISTEMGARGFANIDNVIITSIEEMPNVIKELLDTWSQ